MLAEFFTLQRYAMLTVDNLLDMERCESCERELAAEWKFCIHCGRPVSRSPVSRRTGTEHEAIPSAIRPDVEEPPHRKYDAPFWVGVGMGVLGLALIIYAAVLIYGS